MRALPTLTDGGKVRVLPFMRYLAESPLVESAFVDHQPTTDDQRKRDKKISHDLLLLLSPSNSREIAPP